MTTAELLQRWSGGSITADELRELTAKLAKPEHQSALLDDWLLESSLPDRLPGAVVAGLQESAMNRRIERIAPVRAKQWAGWLSWRPLTAAAAGIVLGIFCTSVLFAISPMRKAMKFNNVLTLLDGGFESGPAKVPAGFPRRTGLWTGDDSERVTSKTPKPSEGSRVLRFIKAGAEPNEIGGSATGCDLYQLVDLRPLRAQIPPQGEAMLKLSADFLDARPQTGPQLQFVCRINLFAGSPEDLHAIWPTGLDENLGSGFGELLSHGGPGANGWRKLAAHCVLPAQADFALVRIICQTPKGSRAPAVFGQQFADNILLQLRTQPLEPDSVVAQ